MHILLLVALLASSQSATPVDSCDDFHWVDRFTHLEHSARRPDWLPNVSAGAAAGREGGAACFRVDEPGRGMKWARAVPAIALAEQPYLVVRYRAENLDVARTDYLVFVDDHTPGRDLCAIRLNEVKADGQWHTAAVDVSAMTEAEAVHAVAVQVQATSQGKARLWLDFLTFSESPPEDAEILARAPSPSKRPDRPIPLAKSAWTPQPGWLANGAPQGAYRGDVSGGKAAFRVARAGSGMKWSWQMPQAVEPQGYRFLSLRYRAADLAPQADYALCVLGDRQGGRYGDTPVVMPAELTVDGRWHTLDADLRGVAKDFKAIGSLAMQVQAAGPDAVLEVAEIRLTSARSAVPLAGAVDWKPQAALAGFQPLPLDAVARCPADPWRRHLRLADWFAGPAVTAHGIPFSLASGGKELAATPVRKKTEIRIPCAAAASEVYLLLLAALEGEEEPAYGAGPFKAIRDVDRFRMRLEYADGTADECLPMNAATKRFGIVPGPQVLVAAADPAKALRAVIVRDASAKAAFAVAAATARTGSRLVPEVLEEGPPLRVGQAIRPDNDKTQVRLGSLTCGGGPTRCVKLTIDGKAIVAEDLEPSAPEKDALAEFKWHRVRTAPAIRLGLAVRAAGKGEWKITARVENLGPAEHTVAMVAPAIGPYRLGHREEDAWYWFPRRGTAFGWRPCSLRDRYCGLFPVQFIDTFNPGAGRGLSLRTLDTQCLEKYYLLEKKDSQFTLGVEYPERRLKPHEAFQSAAAVVSATDGDWHRGLEAYRAWVRTWHQPISPRKGWFREVFNFRQRFLWWLDPLYDARSGKIDLQRAVDEARREFGGVDYLHLFDWGNCGPYGRIYGRTGDLSPYDYLKGGREALRAAIAGIRAQGVPVGLYIEGYLLDERGKLGQGPGKSWQMIGRDGKGCRWPESTEMYVCSYVPEWRRVQASTYAAKVKELDVDGMYLDEFGFAGSWVDCWSGAHGHAVPGYAVAGERDCTQMVRRGIDEAKSGVALYSEETPVDVTTQYQDGSFTYAMSSASTVDTRVPLNSVRFALPDFKTIEILYCDKPTGSWATGVKWVLFNGEAIWLEGPAAEWFEPETREAIRRCHAILRKHRDAFTALAPVPLVSTELGGVFANAFPARGKTVYTFYNARHRTVRGEVLRVASPAGAAWYDEWRQRPAAVRRDGSQTVLSLEIGPHDVGCVVAENK